MYTGNRRQRSNGDAKNAVLGAIDKVKTSLETILGRMQIMKDKRGKTQNHL
jgi:hypothetical protein